MIFRIASKSNPACFGRCATAASSGVVGVAPPEPEAMSDDVEVRGLGVDMRGGRSSSSSSVVVAPAAVTLGVEVEVGEVEVPVFLGVA